ncbi:MAG: SapC family protein [Magnetococcales bacterium]|nr:SapC family protein [Magnetococcales bacterium]
MAQSIFYDKPVPLNKDAHRDLKIGPNEAGFSFAKNTNSVLLSGMEFVHAAKEYPIIFINAGNSILPVALLGFRTDENLFVDDDGKWDAKYIPAFVRRYPFILAEAPTGNEDQNKEMTVCIDEDFPGLNNEEGSPLFDEDGNQTELLDNAITFLQEYQSQYQRTEIFVNRLKELELLTAYTANAEFANGEKISMAGLMVIDEKKLVELEKKKAMELFRSGELSWVYAHLLSLSNMNTVINRMVPDKEADAA